MTKIYQAYLFDLYGTLIDIRTDERMPAVWEKTAAFYRLHNAMWDAEGLRLSFYRRLQALISEHDGCREYEPDLKPVFTDMYFEKGIQPDGKMVQDTATVFRKASTKRFRLYSNAKELLSALKQNGKVILLSNAQSLFTVSELRTLGLSDAFDRIYLSSDYGIKKPSVDFFRLPLDEFGIEPEDCIMIGNDPWCDIMPARQLGMDTFYIHSAISPKDAPKKAEASYSLPGMDLGKVLRILTDGMES